MLTITTDDRRRRLASRHCLVTPAAGVDEAAAAVVGLHSSDPATVYLSARARVTDFKHDDLERALYDDRTLLRHLAMRRTLFVVPVAVAQVMNAACTRAFAPAQRRRVIKLLEDHGISDDGARWRRP